MKGISILGSTGSIGVSTLEVIRQNPERFKVKSLSAGSNIKVLKEQIQEFRPKFVSVLKQAHLKELKKLGLNFKVGYGEEGASEAATIAGVDMVVSAIVGAAGLLPTLSAIRAKKDLALANKESLVIAGSLVTKEVRKNKVKLLPIDSEHSAIFQVLRGSRKKDLKKLILTASGGPFLRRPLKTFESITPKEALNHPTWKMGQRITIDSATLMNKGFEVIEACWLFNVKVEDVDVLIHPGSTVHSMAEFIDGSIIAELGTTDMKGPIAYALGFPERLPSAKAPFNLAGKNLKFMKVNSRRYPCLGLAMDALKAGGTMPAVLNAADEVAVGAFLKGKLSFTGIAKTIEETLSLHKKKEVLDVQDVLEADTWARLEALKIIKKKKF
ncbi:MAG: 1-deoxy-D-xylulose-5-phosphate reductoisomerase [Deltaproteobacteria bacterium]|nr:1-deoxy-D-xylulose-5-phosphate reductoisomerase [Deltaproteobacteria bacterium]